MDDNDLSNVVSPTARGLAERSHATLASALSNMQLSEQATRPPNTTSSNDQTKADVSGATYVPPIRLSPTLANALSNMQLSEQATRPSNTATSTDQAQAGLSGATHDQEVSSDVSMEISSDEEDGGVILTANPALSEHAMMPVQESQSMASSSSMGEIRQLDTFASMTLEEELKEDELEEGEIDPREITIPTQPRSSNRASDRVPTLTRPQPAPWYLEDTVRFVQSDAPRPLLVIVDINGTLLRRNRPGDIGKPRIGLKDFLQYLFRKHVVVFWSSMKPKNMRRVMRTLLDDSQMARVAGIWGRDTLKLTPAQYNAKIQVYKQLHWVWADPSIQAQHPQHHLGARWNQRNTVLLDDSSEKASAQPYNLVQVPELRSNVEGIWETNTQVLRQVEGYLEKLRWDGNVSWRIRRNPF